MQKLEINSLPKSLAEARVVGHNLYYTGKGCKHGHLTYRYVKDRACSDCIKLKVKKLSTVGGGNARRWANKTPEQLAKIYLQRKNYYERTKEIRRKEQRQSVHKLKNTIEWRTKHKENNQTWKLNNIGKVRADVVKRRVSKMQRTPPWLDVVQNAEIEFTYKYCAALRSIGLNYHVDHIVPLQGKTVSGLHVPWNLQVIPAEENIRKANRFET
jgi:hypothetical protein